MRVTMVKVFPKEQRMAVTVQLPNEKLTVNFDWRSKDPQPLPPKHWYRQLQMEIRQHLGKKNSKKSISQLFRGR